MAERYSLYLVRHAIAAERGDEYPDDSKRPLTVAGIARFRKVARGLVGWASTSISILTSPFERARQTADILAEQLRGHPQVVETEALVPGAAHRRSGRRTGHPRNGPRDRARRPRAEHRDVRRAARRREGERSSSRRASSAGSTSAACRRAGPGRLVWFVAAEDAGRALSRARRAGDAGWRYTSCWRPRSGTRVA